MIGDDGRQEKAIANLMKALAPANRVSARVFADLSKREHDDLERLLAAIVGALRLQSFKQWKDVRAIGRDPKGKEQTLLDETYRKLELRGRWKDHVSMADFDSGSVYVVEPYGLTGEDFEDFGKLKKLGWQIWVDNRFGTYFPTEAVPVLFRPPERPLKRN